VVHIYAKTTLTLSWVYLTLLTLFGFFCGYVMSTVMLSVMASSVTTVYVAFARNPQVFQVNDHV
jgi:multisubunit Na+/H+ antiporter MnhE subunit